MGWASSLFSIAGIGLVIAGGVFLWAVFGLIAQARERSASRLSTGQRSRRRRSRGRKGIGDFGKLFRRR